MADVWNSSPSLAPGIVETDKYKSDSYQPKVLMSIVKKYVQQFHEKNYEFILNKFFREFIMHNFIVRIFILFTHCNIFREIVKK